MAGIAGGYPEFSQRILGRARNSKTAPPYPHPNLHMDYTTLLVTMTRSGR